MFHREVLGCACCLRNTDNFKSEINVHTCFSTSLQKQHLMRITSFTHEIDVH